MIWPGKRGSAVTTNGKSLGEAGPGETVLPIVDSGSAAPEDPFVEIKFRIHEQLLRELDLEKVQQRQGPQLRKAIEEAAMMLLAGQETPLSRQERVRLVREIADEVLGLGPLERLLADPTVTEVMVNSPRRVYFERKGILYLSDVTFRDEAHVMRIIDKIISPLGRRIDESSPMVDARLPDGSRV